MQGFARDSSILLVVLLNQPSPLHTLAQGDTPPISPYDRHRTLLCAYIHVPTDDPSATKAKGCHLTLSAPSIEGSIERTHFLKSKFWVREGACQEERRQKAEWPHSAAGPRDRFQSDLAKPAKAPYRPTKAAAINCKDLPLPANVCPARPRRTDRF